MVGSNYPNMHDLDQIELYPKLSFNDFTFWPNLVPQISPLHPAIQEHIPGNDSWGDVASLDLVEGPIKSWIAIFFFLLL